MGDTFANTVTGETTMNQQMESPKAGAGRTAMQPRLPNPATLVPDTMKALVALNSAIRAGGVAFTTLELVHLRASQINGCSSCVDSGARQARRNGESEDRLAAVAAWRTSPHFTEAERAALALSEEVTRLSDRPDPVPDDVWNEAARHYDDRELAALVLSIATTNVFNRINVATRQVAGSWA